MRSFQEYIEEQNRPGGAISDRSLEGFRYLLDELMKQTKGIIDPEVKAQIGPIVRDFYMRMREVLVQQHKQGVGYSPRYQPHQNPEDAQSTP